MGVEEKWRIRVKMHRIKEKEGKEKAGKEMKRNRRIPEE